MSYVLFSLIEKSDLLTRVYEASITHMRYLLVYPYKIISSSQTKHISIFKIQTNSTT